MEEFKKIRAWAKNKNIDRPENSGKQFLKLSEEVGELANALLKDDEAEIIDAIGDCVVVLTILAQQRELLIEGCVISAWQEIKDRRGVTKNGVFVKEQNPSIH